MVGNKKIAFYLFLFIFGIYLITFSGNTIDSSDQQQVRFATTLAMIEEGNLSIPDGMGVKGNYGKDYSWYGIGQPLLSIPFYIFGKSLGGHMGAQGMVSSLNLFVVALSGVVLYLFICNLRYSKKTALTVTIFFAFGTLAWPQSKHPFDHPVEMLFVFLSVYLAYAFIKSGNRWHLLLSSASLGYAFITKEYAVLALLPILVMITLSRSYQGFRCWTSTTVRDCIIYLFVFFPFILIYLLYNYLRFETPFSPGMMVISEREGANLFSTPFITGISGLLLSPGRGFFYYSPVSLLFFFSIKGFYERNRGVAQCFLGIILSYLILLSKYGNWFGGWAWGPRYLLVITPFLMIPVADIIERVLRSGKIIVRYALLSLFMVSIIVQIIGVSVDFQRYFFSLQVKEGVRSKVIGGNGTPRTVELPLEINFELDKFPIAHQAASAINIWMGLKYYRVGDTPREFYSVQDTLKHYIRFNVFDFWWFYVLYAGVPLYSIFVILGSLISIIAFCFIRILRMVNE